MWPRLICRGKRCDYGSPRHDLSAFNVAATDLPRKAGNGVDDWQYIGPSMWPRLICRGKNTSSTCGKKKSGPSMWPRLICRGKKYNGRTSKTIRDTFNVAATDLPRKVPVDTWFQRRWLPSMWPRLICRGKLTLPAFPVWKTPLLQCGRD